MDQVFELKRKKKFTLKEANSLLPVIRKITHITVHQLEKLKNQIEEMDIKPEYRIFYEKKLSEIVSKWAQKISMLGCEPKGLWLVDFDNGEGFYCWHYPEENVEFFHAYEEGFKARTLIL